jgi:hypothetical protein
MILRALTYYLGIGILFGIGHFLLTRKLFDNHPERDNVNWMSLLQISLINGIFTWPVQLLWLSLALLLKIMTWFRCVGKPGTKEQEQKQEHKP